ncbi:hypothetical protein [Microbacterium lacticum]
MSDLVLADVEKELSSNGFAVRDGDLRDVGLASLMQQRWRLVPQKGGAQVSTLKPMEQDAAPVRSLSAVHGLDAQPLHTDGAHLRKMPDVVVLHAPSPTPTGTAVWKLGREYPSALWNGVFTVRGNDGSFLAHAFAEQRLRFDPVCMSPADHLATEAKAFLEMARESAHIHEWNGAGTLLFIDNRKALHGREAVHSPDDAQARVLERATYFRETR